MKPLFFALVLLALVTSAYIKALQLQDDAARNVAQALIDHKHSTSQNMSSSLEKVAQVVQTEQSLEPEQDSKLNSVTTTTQAPPTTSVPEDPDGLLERIQEAEAQIAELKLEPDAEALFAGKQPAHLYSALRRHLLIKLHPGYVRYENEILSRDETLFHEQPLEGNQVISDLYTSLSPEQMRGYGVFFQDLKEMLQAHAEAKRDEERSSTIQGSE